MCFLYFCSRRPRSVNCATRVGDRVFVWSNLRVRRVLYNRFVPQVTTSYIMCWTVTMQVSVLLSLLLFFQKPLSISLGGKCNNWDNRETLVGPFQNVWPPSVRMFGIKKYWVDNSLFKHNRNRTLLLIGRCLAVNCRHGEIESIRVLHERFCAFVNFKNANMAACAMEKLNVSTYISLCQPNVCFFKDS